MMLSDSSLKKVAEILGHEITNKGYEQIADAKFIGTHWEQFSGIDGLVRLDYNFLGMDLSEIANTKFGVFPRIEL